MHTGFFNDDDSNRGFAAFPNAMRLCYTSTAATHAVLKALLARRWTSIVRTLAHWVFPLCIACWCLYEALGPICPDTV